MRFVGVAIVCFGFLGSHFARPRPVGRSVGGRFVRHLVVGFQVVVRAQVVAHCLQVGGLLLGQEEVVARQQVGCLLGFVGGFGLHLCYA